MYPCKFRRNCAILKYIYSRKYGKEPELIEGDIFRIIVPLDDNYSFEQSLGRVNRKTAIKNSDKKESVKKEQHYSKILDFMKDGNEYKTAEIAELLNLKPPHTRKLINELVNRDEIVAIGTNRNRVYKLNDGSALESQRR